MKQLLKEHEEKRRGKKKTAAENVVTFIFLQPVISFQGHGSGDALDSVWQACSNALQSINTL